MQKLGVLAGILLLAWLGLSLFGFGVLVGMAPVNASGDSALVCRYLVGFGMAERYAYGLDPSCALVGR